MKQTVWKSELNGIKSMRTAQICEDVGVDSALLSDLEIAVASGEEIYVGCKSMVTLYS